MRFERDPKLERIQRLNEERELLQGREGTLGYSPLDASEGIERSSTSEFIQQGVSDRIPYRPIEADIPSIAAGGGAGAGAFNWDNASYAVAGEIGSNTRWPGTRGAGGVLEMGTLEVVNGLVSFVESMTGGFGEGGRHALEDRIQRVFMDLRPEVQAALSREFTDLGPEGVLQNPSSYGYQLLKQVPILASLMVPGTAGAVAGGRVGAGIASSRLGAATAGRIPLAPVSERAAGRIIQRGRRTGVIAGATAAGSAGEAVVVGGMTAGEIMSGIENAPDDVLMGAPLYAQLRQDGMDEAQAKRELMNELGRREALNVGAGSVILNIIPSFVFGRILAGASRGRRAFGEAMLAQPITEAMQEPFEGYREDIAARESYDPGRVPGENWLEQSVAGASLGLGSGAAMVGGGYAARRVLGLEKIDENDRRSQQLGGEDVAGAIPPPAPPAPPAGPTQMGLDLQGGGNRYGPPPMGPPVPPTDHYRTRGGVDMPASGIPNEATPMPAAVPKPAETPAKAPSKKAKKGEPAPMAPIPQEATQTEMDLPPDSRARDKKWQQQKLAEATERGTAMQRGEIARRTMDEARQRPKALPAPPPDARAVDEAMLAQETAELTALIDLLRSQPDLSESDKTRLTRARRDLKYLQRSPEAEQIRKRQQARGELIPETQSAETIALPGPLATLETRGPRRGVQSRAQLKLSTVDPQALEAKAARLSQRITTERAAGKDVSRLIAQHTAIQRQLESMDGPTPATKLARADRRIVQAEERIARLSRKRAPRNKRTGKVDEKAKEELDKARAAARAELVRAKSQLEFVQRDIADEAARDAAEAEAPTSGTTGTKRDQTKDLFGARTPEKELKGSWKNKIVDLPELRALRKQLDETKKAEDKPAIEKQIAELSDPKHPKQVAARKQQVHDIVRASMLEVMTALGLLPDSGVYSNAVTRSMMRLRGELARQFKGATTKEALINGIRKVSYELGNSKIGDTPVTFASLLDRVHRNLTGEPIPAEFTAPVALTTEQAAQVMQEGERASGVTPVVVEGADISEDVASLVDFDTPADAEVNFTAVEKAIIDAEQAASDTVDVAALGVTEAELADMGRLSEETSETLDAADDISMDVATTDVTTDAAELAKLQVELETADTYSISLPGTTSNNPLQRVIDQLGRDQTRSFLRDMLDLFGRRETSRLLRQTLALFSDNGLFTTNADAKTVLRQWRGNVMAYALQQGDTELAQAMSLMSDQASADLQATWFLRGMSLLARNMELNVSLKEMLAGKDVELLLSLGRLSENLRERVNFENLGRDISEFGVLTDKTDEQLLAMKQDDLRKFVNSRLGIPLPRKGVKESGYTKEDMVRALREREAAMRESLEIFVDIAPELSFDSDQWVTLLREGLSEVRISDIELERAIWAFRKGMNNDVLIKGRTYTAGLNAATANMRHVVGTELFPTNLETIAKTQNMTQRQAQVVAARNTKLINRMMNRVSERFGRAMAESLKEARTTGKQTFLSPEEFAKRTANELIQSRTDSAQSARLQGAARKRLANARERQREMLLNPDNFPALDKKYSKKQLRALYGRYGLPVPGEPVLPKATEVEGGAELMEQRITEGRVLYGNDQPLERTTENLPLNWYNRLNVGDAAAAYIDDQISRIEKENPGISKPAMLKQLRQVLENAAFSSADNRISGQLTDAQFVQLLEGLGFTRAYPDAKLGTGRELDRSFAVARILNSISAFGQPIFTGGAFMNSYVQQAYMLGEYKTTIIGSLNSVSAEVVASIARYLNNDNPVEGNKSTHIQFIMDSDRMHRAWAETAQDRALLAAAEGTGLRNAQGQFIKNKPMGVSSESATNILLITEGDRDKARAELNEVIAEYDRLVQRHKNDPRVLQTALEERQALIELRNLIKEGDFKGRMRRKIRTQYAKIISGIKARLEVAQAHATALENELGQTRKRDMDWQGNISNLRIADLRQPTLDRVRGQLLAYIGVLQSQGREATKAKNPKRRLEISNEIQKLRQMVKAIEAAGLYRERFQKSKSKADQKRVQTALEKLQPLVAEIEPTVNETRTGYLEASLNDQRKHVRFLQAQLQLAEMQRKEELSAPPAMTVEGLFEQIHQSVEQQRRTAENIQLDIVSKQQLAEQAAESALPTAMQLNQSEQAKRTEQRNVRRAEVWPRAGDSLRSLIAWAVEANRAHKKFMNELTIGRRAGRDLKNMVTTSSMETIAPYSNEMIVGAKVYEFLFQSRDLKKLNLPHWLEPGRIAGTLPTYLRGPVKQLAMDAPKDERLATEITFGRKTYKLADMNISAVSDLRGKIAAKYAKNPTDANLKMLEDVRSFMDFDYAMRLAYLTAYNLMGDIHLSQQGGRTDQQVESLRKRWDKMTPEQQQANTDKLIGKVAKTDSTTVTSTAKPRVLTPKQKRAAMEQERDAERTATEEFKHDVKREHMDKTPAEEFAELEKATAEGTVLPQFWEWVWEDRNKRDKAVYVGNMEAQKRRLAELVAQQTQTTDEAIAAVEARQRQRRNKQHMDLPASEARATLSAAAPIADALRAAKTQTNSMEVLNRLIASEAFGTLPAVTRFMLQSAQRLGINVPIRWVNSEPTSGKTFLARFVFDKDNPAKGREILINRSAYDAMLQRNDGTDTAYSVGHVDGRLAHAFVHELAHVMTYMGLVTNPEMNREMGRLMGMARNALGNDHYGLTNVFEFTAEYFGNEAFQRDLHSIRLNLDGSSVSLWQRITDFVRSIIGMPRETTTMFQYMMDKSSALFMSEHQLQHFDTNNLPHELANGYLNYEVTMDGLTTTVANQAELAAEQAKRNEWLLRLSGATRNLRLAFMTLDQIGESHAGLAQKYTNLQNRKWAEVNRDMDSATRIMQDFAALDPGTSMKLSTLMLDATRYGIHPDQPLGPNTLNAHLPASRVTTENYKALSEQYNSLPQEAKDIYSKVKQRHAEDFAKTTQYVTTNLMAAFDFDVNSLPTNWYQELSSKTDKAERAKYLQDLWEKHGLPDERTGLKREKGFSEEDAEALHRLARRPQLMQGPYFPLKRFGKWVVRARAKATFTFANEREMGEVLSEIKEREPGAKFEGFTGNSLTGTVTIQLTELRETQGQALKLRAGLFKTPPRDMQGNPLTFKGQTFNWAEIPPVMQKNQMPMYELAGHYSSSFLNKLQQKLRNNPAGLAAVKEAYLQMLPDTSMRKHELRRGNYQGASNDMIRSFAATTKAAAFGNAQIKYGRLLSNEMREMNVAAATPEQQAVVDELRKRDLATANFMEDSPLGVAMDRLTEGGFVWFLGSPSYWMVNATQPYLLTLPYLSARYGTAASYAALARARKVVFPTLAGKAARSGLGLKALRRDPKAHRAFMNDVFGGLDDILSNVKDPGQRAMLAEIEEMGLIDLTIAKDLNQTIKEASQGKIAKAWESVVDTTRVMPHLVEVLNRSMTAIAAYDLATRRNMSHEQATAVALDAVRKTQFNYSAVNKARFMSRSTSELLRPVMLFQQYAQHVYYLMLRSAVDGFSAAKTAEERKVARQTFFRILGAHTMAAGVIGGMFEPIKIAAGMIFGLAQFVGLGDEDDDFDTWLQRGASELLGERGGRTFSKGIPYGLAGLDLHGRVGLNNLIWMTDPRVKGMEGSEWLMHKLFGGLGALGSTAAAMSDIPQKTRRGDFYGALSSAMPKAIRDLSQAGRWQNTGVLDYTGNLIMGADKIDTLSLAYKVTGFAPSQVSAMYASRAAVKRVETRISKRRNNLLERWRRADTPAAKQNVLNDIHQFNQNYPEFRIDGRSRLDAIRRKRENERQAAQQGGYFSAANARQQQRLRRYGEF